MEKNKIMISFAFASILICSLCFYGCSDDKSKKIDTTDPRFIEAETMSTSWCAQAQIITASLEGSALGYDQIDNTILPDPNLLSAAHSGIDPASDRPIEIHTALITMPDTGEPSTPNTITKEAYCKLKSIDSIEALLSVDIDAAEGTCRSVNETALEWALNQLTEEERTRYETQGKQLIFDDDQMNSTGPNWYGSCIGYDNTDDIYSLSSPSLIVPYDPSDDSYVIGVHYCKLLTPAQVLYWLLYRAYLDDPTEPDDDDSSLICDQCVLTETTPVGSCIFYFSTSGQHFCEDYTGSDWTTVISPQDKCAERTVQIETTVHTSVYSASRCADRTAETSTLDDDGEYKGICAINCGETGEYLWHVYSEPSIVDMSAEEACYTSWFPAE